jgi:hypothetical protein
LAMRASARGRQPSAKCPFRSFILANHD